MMIQDPQIDTDVADEFDLFLGGEDSEDLNEKFRDRS